MKKLKNKLLFSVLIILLFIFIFRFLNSKSIINPSLNYFEGTVTDIHKSDDKTSLILNGREKVIIIYYGNLSCKLGQRLRVYGKFNPPSSNKIFNLFNYKNYLLSKGIYYVFRASNVQIISHNISLKYKIKNYITDRIERYRSNSYLKAFILGDTSEISEDGLESYRNNGISHLFAVSGLHIGIVGSFLRYFFNRIFNNKNISYFITILLLLFYLFLADFSLSLFRAVLFFILVYFNKLFNLKFKPIYLLILTCLILLAINPFYVYNLGFLLSFVITFYIVLFGSITKKYSSKLSKSFVISVIAFFSSAPILINSFFRLNFLSFILSIIFGPLITFVIYPVSLISFFFKSLLTFEKGYFI